MKMEKQKKLNINDKYINGIKQIGLKFQIAQNELNKIENDIIETREKLMKWIDENTKLLNEYANKDNPTEEDIDAVEDIVIEYEELIAKMSIKMKPLVKTIEIFKKDLNNLYEQIMKEYGKHFSEDEIIEYIKDRI